MSLQIMDILLTSYALEHGLSEGNPFMTTIVNNIFLFVIIKLAGTITIIEMYLYISNKNNTAGKIAISIVNLMMLIVVINNIIAILNR